MGGNPLSASRKTEPFFRSGLYADAVYRHAANPGDILSHFSKVRLQLGRLSHNGCIDITYSEAVFAEKQTDMLEQQEAVSPGISGVAVRKMDTDISERGGTEKRVHDRMGQHIRVGVAKQTKPRGNFHTAQNQFSSFRKTVHIITVSDSHANSSLRRRIASAATISSCVVNLMFS